MENNQGAIENGSSKPEITLRTNWNDPTVCSLYDAHDKAFDIKLGILPMIADLKQTQGTNAIILDYGCGSGAVSRLLEQEKFAKIEAVDTSEIMINIAISHSVSQSINYQKITSAELPYADNHFDAAICSFVLLNIHTRDELSKVIGEIYRTYFKTECYVLCPGP